MLPNWSITSTRCKYLQWFSTIRLWSNLITILLIYFSLYNSFHLTGLFTQVISHSGAPLSPWVVKENPIGFYNMITRDINCQLVNSESTMECLRNVSYQTFLDLDVPTPLYSYSFGPVVDGNIVEEDPAKLIQKVTEGQRNITTMAYMTGMTKNEGFRYLSSSVDIVGRIEQNVYEQTLHGFVQNNFGSNRIARYPMNYTLILFKPFY